MKAGWAFPSVMHQPVSFLAMRLTEKYYKYVMNNYAALVAKLQCTNLPLPRDYFAVSALCSNMCYIGCDWHNFNMAMGQKRYTEIFSWLYLRYEAFFREDPLNLWHYFMSSVARSA